MAIISRNFLSVTDRKLRIGDMAASRGNQSNTPRIYINTTKKVDRVIDLFAFKLAASEMRLLVNNFAFLRLSAEGVLEVMDWLSIGASLDPTRYHVIHIHVLFK